MSSDSASRQPTVLVLASTLPRWNGDPEPRFVLDLARSISPRFKAIILAPMAPGSVAREVMEGIEVRRFRYAPLRRWERVAAPGAILPNLRARPWLTLLVPAFFLGQLLALVKILRTQHFDVVHCHWMIPQGLTLAVCSLLIDTPPVLLTCHGADAFTLNSAPMRRIKSWILRRADAITVVSREIRAFMAERIDSRVMSRCRHISMGVDIELFQRSMTRGRPRPTRILYAGRLSEKKGVEHLLRAVASRQVAERDVQVRIVGDGPLRERLEQLSDSLGLMGRVTFVGAVPHRELSRELHRATIFCLPSVIARSGDREGTPTVLLEAAAASLPIIASDVGGCRDLIVAGRSGWLIPPGDEQALVGALIDAIDHPDVASMAAVEANKRVQEYAWSRIGERYADELEGLTHAAMSREHTI